MNCQNQSDTDNLDYLYICNATICGAEIGHTEANNDAEVKYGIEIWMNCHNQLNSVTS